MSSSEECVHTRDEERALNGTWVIVEVNLAVEKIKGYSRLMRCTSIRLPSIIAKQARAVFSWIRYKHVFETESDG